MGEIQNLREQVRKLKSRLDQIEGTPSSKVVAELVGQNGDERSGRFSAACDQAGANAHRELRAKAVRELNADPALIVSPHATASFRELYCTVHDIDRLIDLHHRGHKVE